MSDQNLSSFIWSVADLLRGDYKQSAKRLYLITGKFVTIDLHPSPEHIEDITRLFGECKEVTRAGVPISRIFKNDDFGYRTITVERPERDAKGNVVPGTKGKGKGQPVPDSSLRDTENVPLSEDVDADFKREVLPHAPDAWVDYEKTQVGYEIPFNRHFCFFKPPRPLVEIDAELKGVTDRIFTMIGGLTK